MYEVSTEVYENILQEMKEELNVRDYDYSESALREILNRWMEQKQPLLELMSKHQNWDADRLMIKFDADFARDIDVVQAKKFVVWLRSYTNIKNQIIAVKSPFGYEDDQYNLGLIFECVFIDNTYLQEADARFIDGINKLSDTFRFRPGMKVTKVVRKICEHFGWDKVKGIQVDIDGSQTEYNAFEREYAKFCDAICPIKVTRHTCISLNPIDFLLMSYGNSWNSCHYIGNDSDGAGCYSSGTISYMLDCNSFVFYTVSSDYNGVQIERQKKLQRQMFGYNDNQLFQSRLYPQANDCGAKQTYTDIRNIVQKVIADCCDKPNLWIKHKAENVWRGDDATVYPDWEHFDGLCSISTFKDTIDCYHDGIEMGAEPICIKCGYGHSTEDNISCCEPRWACECCGSSIDDEEDVYYVRDSAYCRDCVIYCDICGEYELCEHSTYIEGEGIDVCDDCRDDHFTWCRCCEEYVRNEDAVYIDSEDDYVCSECLENYYEKCHECGEYVYNDNGHEVEDKETGEYLFYCEGCFNAIEEDEDEDDEEEAV